MTDVTGKAAWIRKALDRHEGSLLRYATRLTGDVDRARDAVQETFLGLCQQERSRVEDHLAAWLFRVCRNRALDLRRKEKPVELLESSSAATLPSPEPGPAVLAERREGTSQVLAVVESLPENQREVITLRFQNGLSYREISEVTGHSVSHVGVLLHNAVKNVRARLADPTVARDDHPPVSAGGAR